MLQLLRPQGNVIKPTVHTTPCLSEWLSRSERENTDHSMDCTNTGQLDFSCMACGRGNWTQTSEDCGGACTKAWRMSPRPNDEALLLPGVYLTKFLPTLTKRHVLEGSYQHYSGKMSLRSRSGKRSSFIPAVEYFSAKKTKGH